MSAHGISQEEIALVLGIDPKTLRAHYAHELDTAGTEANHKVAGSLYSLAMGDPENGIPPNVTAIIFWLKTRARWKEAKDVARAGEDDTVVVTPTQTIVIKGGLPQQLTEMPKPNGSNGHDHDVS